jgi:hypothetical protein
MRAPGRDVARLIAPDMRHVSDSEIEHACRSAGEHPQGSANRRHRLRRIARLFTAEISNDDLKVVAKFLRGAFDRKRGHGRPANLPQRAGLDSIARRARAIHQRDKVHGCTLKDAIVIALKVYGMKPTERTINYVRNKINRG